MPVADQHCASRLHVMLTAPLSAQWSLQMCTTCQASIDCRIGWLCPFPKALYSLHTQALGVAVSAAVRGSDKLAFAVAPGITVILMLFGK